MELIKSTTLNNTGESIKSGRVVRHNKQYTVQLSVFRSAHASVQATATIYTVTGTWGKIGGTPKTQIKYQGSNRYEANRAFDARVNRQLGRGYYEVQA